MSKKGEKKGARNRGTRSVKHSERPSQEYAVSKGRQRQSCRPSYGVQNLATIFKEAANHPVQATISGKTQTMTAQATIFQLAASAARGDHRATTKFLDYLDEFEKRAAAARPVQYPFGRADLEVLKAIYQRMKQCQPTQ